MAIGCRQSGTVKTTWKYLAGMISSLRNVIHCSRSWYPPRCYQHRGPSLLTLGAMTIPAAVIADTDIPAFGTNLYMPAKGTGPALGYVGKGSSDRCYDVMSTKELFSMLSDDLTKVVGSPHFFLGGKMVSISRTCFVGSMSAT